MQCFVVHNVLFAFDKLYCFFLISFSSFLLCLSFFRFFFFCFTSELFTPPFFLLLCLVSNLLCLCFIYILFLPCKSLVCFHTHLQTSVQSLCILTVFLPSQIGGYLLTFFNFIHFVICSLRPTPVPCLWILTAHYTFYILLIFSLQSLMTWMQTYPGWLPSVLQAACQLSTLTPSALWKKLCSAPTPAPSSSLDL